MHVESSPTPKDAIKRHRIQVARVPSKSLKTASRFFYIGNADEAIQTLSHCFVSGTVLSDFAEAQDLIRESGSELLIDAIFIDIPLYKSELETFCRFLKERNLLSQVAVIYNERKLDFSNIKLLRTLQLIDDVVDLTSDAIDYDNKIEFIKKIKSRIAATTSVPKPSSVYGINTEMIRRYAARQIKTGKQLFSFKRLLDIALAVLALLILSPVFLLIVIGIKLTSKGPVFYTSLRAGQGFRIFEFYKFRTMEADADKKIEALAHLNQYGINEDGPLFFKLTHDPRITKFGMFLRNTSMDELPQLFNVIKGDMSLVGNRPLPLYEAATLTTNAFVERFMAPAGITGLWQVKKRGRAQMSIEERINLDILYARRANLLYDLRIIASTPAALWQKTNV